MSNYINLKEAFRYQKYLDKLLSMAIVEMTMDQHIFKTTENHLYNDTNPDKSNVVIEQETDDYVGNDVIVEFIKFIISQKECLTRAINKAKNSMDFDIDALVASNKMRRDAVSYMRRVLLRKPSTYKDTGHDWKFNEEGNQASYCYTIEITKDDNFDRNKFRESANNINRDAESISSKIDSGLINTVIEYEVPFDVDEDLDQVLRIFTNHLEQSEQNDLDNV